MDVRCEKCLTEYELDESRLKPSGVTVKCTNCGHMFKIRKRTPTAVGAPVPARPQAARPSAPPATKPAEPKTEIPPGPPGERLPTGGDGDRVWMVRLENGETRRCKELKDLQQWIVAGEVTRDSLISRTGKTWKRIGDIAELGSFFTAAEQSPGASTPLTKRTVLGFGAGVPSNLGSNPPPSKPMSTPPPPAPEPRLAMPLPAPDERRTGAWANSEIKPLEDTGKWKGSLEQAATEPSFSGIPRDTSQDELYQRDENAARRRRAQLWIAIGAAAVLSIASVLVIVVMSGGGKKKATPVVVEVIPDAAALPPDAAAVAVAADAAPPPDPLAEAREALLLDTREGLAEAGQQIASLTDPPALAVRVRLLTAIAQTYTDEAASKDAKTASALRKEAKLRLVDAVKLAQQAQAAAMDDPAARVAMADLLRQQASPTREVRRHLDRALAKTPDDREAKLVAALLDLRDGKTAAATSQLQALDSGDGALEKSGDVRPRFYLALLSKKSNPNGAREAVVAVLGVSPEHAGAKALSASFGAAAGTPDPMPPEEKPLKPDAGVSGGTTTPPVVGAESYDKVLAQAHKLAEIDCGKAMPLYEKAIDMRPAGVEALTGAGYCHIDAKEFSSAHSKFKAALAVSPRYERALWGIAEAYQQQGRNDLAVEAYRRYLETFPDSAAAQKQLDRLGAGGGGGGGEKPPEPPPAPPSEGANPAPANPAPATP